MDKDTDQTGIPVIFVFVFRQDGQNISSLNFDKSLLYLFKTVALLFSWFKSRHPNYFQERSGS